MDLVSFKDFLKRCPLTAGAYQAAKRALRSAQGYTVTEIEPLLPRVGRRQGPGIRLNLLIPSVDRKHAFGGISTALRFFEALQNQGAYAVRVIVTDDMEVASKASVLPAGYVATDCGQDPDLPRQLITMEHTLRSGKTLPVTERDVFVATAWWTAYIAADVIRWQSRTFQQPELPLIYLVQDYEPGFYPWSTRYVLAESTYQLDIPVYAVLNSSILEDYFHQHGYSFTKSWSFSPKLNPALKAQLPAPGSILKKKKQILVYGRPSVARNTFELLIYALKLWCERMQRPEEWTLLSAGEQHDDIPLGRAMTLHSVGKLTLEEYALMMRDTYAGISLMVSPHPSYPPLEMASFGIKTITNRYANKDLSEFSKNMISLETCSPREIALALERLCLGYDATGVVTAQEAYLSDGSEFDAVPEALSVELQSLDQA